MCQDCAQEKEDAILVLPEDTSGVHSAVRKACLSAVVCNSGWTGQVEKAYRCKVVDFLSEWCKGWLFLLPWNRRCDRSFESWLGDYQVNPTPHPPRCTRSLAPASCCARYTPVLWVAGTSAFRPQLKHHALKRLSLPPYLLTIMSPFLIPLQTWTLCEVMLLFDFLFISASQMPRTW